MNGYPSFCIDKCIKQFMKKIYSPTETLITVPRENIYIKLKYLGQISKHLIDFIIETLKKIYTQMISNFALKINLLLVVFFKT